MALLGKNLEKPPLDPAAGGHKLQGRTKFRPSSCPASGHRQLDSGHFVEKF